MLANGVVDAALGAIASALDTLGGLDLDGLTTLQVLKLADRCETMARRLAVSRYDLALNVSGRSVAELGEPAHKVLANWLRITPGEAKRRIRMAGPLATIVTITGQPLPPRQPGTAEAWRAGELDPEHLRTIQRFLKDLPTAVAEPDRDDAEVFLAE